MKSGIIKRYINVGMAFILALGVVTPSISYVLSQKVYAAPNISYGTTSFGGYTWSADRTAPSGGYTATSNTLTLTVDNQNASATPGFYRTEGVKTTFGSSAKALKAELYIDSAWGSKPIRAGMWGVVHSATSGDTSWPIIEYTTIGDAGFSGWRVWDTINGGWTNLPSVNASAGSWYTVEVVFNKDTNTYDYYVNDSVVYSLPAIDGADTFDKIDGAIFNSFNSATGNSADNYSVQWRNFVTGQRQPGVPTIVKPTNSQYFTNGSIMNQWNAVSDAASYQVAYHYDDGHSFGGSTCSGTTIPGYSGFIGCRDVAGTSRTHTPGTTEQGGVTIWVRSVSADNIKSEWSAPVHYVYDATAPATPTLVTPSDNAVVKGASITQSWADSSSDVHHYIYESYNDAAATSLRWHATYTATSKTATNVAEASYWWRVKAVDHAGNVSPWSELRKITVDNTAPVATIDSIAPKAFYNSATQIQVHAIDTNYLQTDLYRDTDTTPFKTYTGAYFGLFWLQDGKYRMTVRDRAGNATTYQFTIDKTRPDVAFTLPTDFSAPFSLLSEIRIAVSDSLSGISATPVVHVYKSNGDPAKFCSGTTCDTSLLADGDYYVKAGVNDNAGNNKTITQYFSIDKTAPVVQITAPSDSDVVRGVVKISGTVTDVHPDHYYLVVKNASGAVVAGPGTVYAANVTDYLWDTTTLADGGYTIDLEARDAANNKDGNSTQVISVTVDNTGPVVTYVGFTQLSNAITPDMSATDVHNPLSYLWNAVDTNSASNVSISDTTVLAPTFTVIADGSYAFELIVTDQAGNKTTKAFSFTYTTPVSAPATQPVVSAAGQLSNTNTPNNAFTDVTVTDDTTDDSAVLGTSTDNSKKSANNNSDKDVLGSSTEKQSSWNLFSIAWYWWLLLLALIVTIGAYFYTRSRQAKD